MPYIEQPCNCIADLTKMASEAPQDVSMASPPPVPAGDDETKFGGYSRFEIELEVRCPIAVEELPLLRSL